MKLYVKVLALLTVLLFISMMKSSAQFSLPVVTTKRVIISFRAKSPAEKRNKVLVSIKGKQVSNILGRGNDFIATVVDVPQNVINGQGSPWWFQKPTTDQAIMAIIPEDVKAEVIKVEEDYRVRWIEEPSFQSTPLPSVSSILSSLPKLHLAAIRPEMTWGVERVHAPAAWQMTEGKGIRVGVIDTGIDQSHPDLVGQVDGGYDAISKSTKKEDYQDQNGHGTHVAGTIAALRNGKGVVGVAPKVRLYAIRVLDADGSGSLSDVIDGIIWCANNGIQVANMSLGSRDPSDTMQRALRYAMYSGVITVAAAGNSGAAVGYPGAFPEVIGVAASDADDKVAVFSSRGPEVDFIAPGVDVVSTKMGGGYVSFSGTSMATPHMAGIVALAVSQGWVGLEGPDGVMGQLKKSAVLLPNLKETEQGAGLVDCARMVR